MSFPALSASSYTPVFDNIMGQKLLERNMFSFYYSKLPKQGSAVVFGEPSKVRLCSRWMCVWNDRILTFYLQIYYEGDIEWVDVEKEVYWELKLKDIYIGDEPMNLCPNGPCKAVVDTGTSLLTGPSAAVASVRGLPLI